MLCSSDKALGRNNIYIYIHMCVCVIVYACVKLCGQGGDVTLVAAVGYLVHYGEV